MTTTNESKPTNNKNENTKARKGGNKAGGIGSHTGARVYIIRGINGRFFSETYFFYLNLLFDTIRVNRMKQKKWLQANKRTFCSFAACLCLANLRKLCELNKIKEIA